MANTKSAETITGMYKAGKLTVNQVMASVKGKLIDDDQAKEILGDKYPKKEETQSPKETAPKNKKKN